MNRQELIDFCLTMPSAFEDYPFDEVVNENATTVMRHRGNKKTFALIMYHDDKLCINLKCEPFEAETLRQSFEDVLPGWHMNKKHWNTVVLGGDVPEEMVKRMIENSYDLIKPKVKPRR